MRAIFVAVVAAGLAVFTGSPVAADDVSGARHVLCSVSEVTVSTDGGVCEVDLPSSLNLPRFFEIDLESGRMATTEASGENRATTVESVRREDGLVILQGVENGRAFSFLLAEESGLVTIAVARDGLAVTAFGACTPVPAPAAGAQD